MNDFLIFIAPFITMIISIFIVFIVAKKDSVLEDE